VSEKLTLEETIRDGLRAGIEVCHGAAVDGGWWHDINTGEKLERNKGELIALIHSEVSECLEGVRKGCPDDKLPNRPMEEVELADTIIRIFDYAGGFGLDLPGALLEKLAYNSSRADHKPENRKKSGGKKF
jgi:NTP pyrophosphatase (non-canonical NTP hydrolase)